MVQQETREAGTGRAAQVPYFSLVLAALGVLNLVVATERFHLLMGLGCLAGAVSLILGFWRRSPTRGLDVARAPLAVLLFVWTVGLEGYAALSDAGTVFDRCTAGLLGSLYVVDFVERVLSGPHGFAGGSTGERAGLH